jgi:hypothetical protein
MAYDPNTAYWLGTASYATVAGTSGGTPTTAATASYVLGSGVSGTVALATALTDVGAQTFLSSSVFALAVSASISALGYTFP